ncbi:hypothetical protein CsSME_00001142 [Camellia sinensis var. sinensis]
MTKAKENLWKHKNKEDTGNNKELANVSKPKKDTNKGKEKGNKKAKEEIGKEEKPVGQVKPKNDANDGKTQVEVAVDLESGDDFKKEPIKNKPLGLTFCKTNKVIDAFAEMKLALQPSIEDFEKHDLDFARNPYAGRYYVFLTLINDANDMEEATPLSSKSESDNQSSEDDSDNASDITNLLIPTSTILGKLSSSLSTTPPFPNSKPYNSKPYNPDTNSDTSIGSSNHNPNPSTTFKTHPSTPSPLSISIPGNGSEEADEPLVVYSRRQTIEKTKKNGKAFESVSVSCPPRLKTKDKGKAVAVPPSFSSLGKTKDRENAVSVPISFRSLVNTRNEGKAIATPCPPLPRTRRRRRGAGYCWSKMFQNMPCHKNLLRNRELTLKRLMILNYQRRRY